jgi:hypothetical protein
MREDSLWTAAVFFAPSLPQALGIGVGGPAERLAQKLDLISECLRLEATEIARHVAESDAAAR